MSKVTGTAKLFKDPQRGWVLVPTDLNNLKAQAVEKFIKHDTTTSVILDMELKRPYVAKTLSQLGYLHAAVYPQFYNYYTEQGIPGMDSQEQREKCRNDIKDAVNFTHQVESSLGMGPRLEVKSLADASREEVSEFIDSVIRLAAGYGIIVPTPEEYLEQHGAKEFES